MGDLARGPPLLPDRLREPAARAAAVDDQLHHARPRLAADSRTGVTGDARLSSSGVMEPERSACEGPRGRHSRERDEFSATLSSNDLSTSPGATTERTTR